MTQKTIKVLTLWQPWATLVSIAAKQYETRSWTHPYRGPLAIHAATYAGKNNRGFFNNGYFYAVLTAAGYQGFHQLPRGEVLCIVNLTGIYHTERIRAHLTDQELQFGDFSPGRAAWKLEDVELLPEPIPAKGKQGLWEFTYDG